MAVHEVELTLADFEKQFPVAPKPAPARFDPPRTFGAEIHPLAPQGAVLGTEWGSLVELGTLRDGDLDRIVHVYQVFTEPGSVRAWNYHEHQTDRLAFTMGQYRVVLYDLRPESPTHGLVEVFDLGEAAPARLHIPPFVAHGVQCRGDRPAAFVNLPTNVFYPGDPDKRRIPPEDPRVPYRFTR